MNTEKSRYKLLYLPVGANAYETAKREGFRYISVFAEKSNAETCIAGGLYREHRPQAIRSYNISVFNRRYVVDKWLVCLVEEPPEPERNEYGEVAL